MVYLECICIGCSTLECESDLLDIEKQLIVTTGTLLCIEFDNTDRRRACGSPKRACFSSGRPLATLMHLECNFLRIKGGSKCKERIGNCPTKFATLVSCSSSTHPDCTQRIRLVERTVSS